MKKTILITILLMIAIILSACNNGQIKETSDPSESSAEYETNEPRESETDKVSSSHPQTTEPDTETADTETADTETAASDSEERSSETVEPTPVDTEPADTEQTEDTDAEEQPIVPDQSYVGHWIGYATTAADLYIGSIDADSVSFSVGIAKWFDVTATAVKQGDIYVFNEELSPKLEFSCYEIDKTPETLSGSITFYKNEISIRFDGDGIDGHHGPRFDMKKESFDALEQPWTDIINKMNEYGWERDWTDKSDMHKNVPKTQTGYWRGREYLNCVEPCELEYDFINCIPATSGDFAVVLRILYTRESDKWVLADAAYVYKNTFALQGEELREFISVNGKPSLLLAPDDADLVKYFEDLETAADGTDISE